MTNALNALFYSIWDTLSVISYVLIFLSYMMPMRKLRMLTLGTSLLDIVIYYHIRPEAPMVAQIIFNIATSMLMIWLLWLRKPMTKLVMDLHFKSDVDLRWLVRAIAKFDRKAIVSYRRDAA